MLSSQTELSVDFHLVILAIFVHCLTYDFLFCLSQRLNVLHNSVLILVNNLEWFWILEEQTFSLTCFFHKCPPPSIKISTTKNKKKEEIDRFCSFLFLLLKNHLSVHYILTENSHFVQFCLFSSLLNRYWARYQWVDKSCCQESEDLSINWTSINIYLYIAPPNFICQSWWQHNLISPTWKNMYWLEWEDFARVSLIRKV